ncbi:MAG TPA: DNA polymerase, partial [Tissierellaceae bacterium]|nr:DNA polymerase [Tissierellaceae bacterium]
MQLLSGIFSLTPSKRLVIYVHNLGYEFQFMRKYFEWEEVFSVDLRKPIKAVTTSGIEFRCSYILSGFSLERLAKNLVSHKVDKLIGDLDYSLVRHSETVLTLKEIDYAINDVVIVLNYITEQLEYYGDINRIPMTNTGRVRRFVRDRCYYTNNNHKKSSRGKYIRYRRLMEDLTLTPEVYKMLVRAFMGGFTHANANYSGKVLENVTSIDFNSSYPAVMLAEQFPMSKAIPTKLTKEKDFNYYRRRFCLLFNVRFKGLIAKIPQENYISESKCFQLEGALINNGRVQKADVLATTITEVDFEIIEQAYEWESIEISNLYRFYKGYLPYSIIQSVISLYEDKTVLKGVEGSEVEYLLSKGMLNSVYGMCVTAVVRDEISYTDDWEELPPDVEKQIEDYNNSRNRFLYYPWGIWVTAYARRNLWFGIIAMGEDYIYSDTDSIKFLNYEKHKEFIKRYDNLQIEKLKKMCSLYKIDFERLKPKTKEGKTEILGVWDLDGHYSKFKTLGSKRYLVEHEDSGELELTVAGLSKANGLEYMKKLANYDNTKVFELFNDNLYIP